MCLASIRAFCRREAALGSSCQLSADGRGKPGMKIIYPSDFSGILFNEVGRKLEFPAKEPEMKLELEQERSLYPFVLTEEQEQLQREIRTFAAREIAPNVMKWDEASEFPLATIKELGKLGLMGTIFPPEYGGAGMGYVEYVTAIEELSRVDGSVGIIVAAHTSLCSNHIFLAGNEAQKKKYVSKLATGEFI